MSDIGPAAILSVLVSADTGQASSRLSEFDARVKTAQRQAAKGIQTRLGATFDPAAFQAYELRMSAAARRTADRKAFRAELGANFNNTAFNAYERAIDKAIADSARLTRQQEEQAVKQQTAARKSLGNFFTGSKTGNGEERSFARGTLRGTVGRGAGFIGSGLAGGLLGFVSAQGIKNAIEGTTQLVKQAEILHHYTGMSAQSALEFEATANALGVSARGVATGFRTLATATNTALTKPTAASTEAFRQLGLSQDEVKAHSKDLGTLFGIVADKLNQLPAGSERTALAAKLLGRNWQQLAPLIEQGSQGMKDQMKQAQALGVTLGGSPLQNIAKLHEAQINLKIAQEGLSFQFTQHLAPALIKGTTGFIKLAEGVRHDLAPAFKVLSPILKDVGHWFEQNKALVGVLVGAFVGLKIVRTVGGWFIGLRKDIGDFIGWGKKLIPFFAESGAAADAETAQINGLAAAYERLALAQKGTLGGGLPPIAGGAAVGAEAAGAGAAGFGFGLGALPFAALYLAGVGRTSPGGVQGANGRSARGLAALLGPVGASYVRRTALGASSNPAVMARFGDVGATYGTKQINDPNTLRELKALQSGLRGVSNVSQLTTGQLALYYQQIQKLLRQPDLTAAQRRGIQTLEGMLVNGLTPAINKALNTQQYSAKAKALIDSFHKTFSWLPTYAHTAGVTASQKLLVAEEELRQIMRTGSRKQREAARGELTKLVTEYKGWMSDIVTHTRGAEAAARGPIHKLAQDWVNTGNTIQRVLVQMADALAKTFGGGFHNAPLTKNAPPWLKGGGGWNVPTAHHAAAHAAAKHMEWNPFTSTYQLMTSAHHQRLRDLYISEFGKTPSTGPSHAKSSSGPSSSSTSTRTTAAGTQNAFQAPSQSASFQIAMQNIQNALQTAQNSNNVAGQQRLLGREIKLDRKAIGLDDRKLAQIGKQLRGSISKAKRAQLMQDKLTVLQDLGQLRSDIGNAMSQLQSATSASAGTFDLAPAGASVTAPTIYDVRRAARGERHKLAEQHHHGDVHIGDIHIHDRKDVDYFADRLDRALGSGVHAKLRAAGMRGT